MSKYAIGLDYGTNSVRAIVVDVASGREAGTAVYHYEHGEEGILLSGDPNLARQHPADYVTGAEVAIRNALAAARREEQGLPPGSGDRHRRGHDRQHAAARGLGRPAAGLR